MDKNLHNFCIKKISKYYLAMFLIVSFCCCFVGQKVSHAEVTVLEKQYARITRSNIAVYDVPDVTSGKVMFYPEISYFVQLLEPESSGFYRIKYNDVEGYILSSDLIFVSGVPQNPFPTGINVKILSNSGLHLRSTPTSADGPFNIIATLPFLESNIEYIAKTYGEEYAPNTSDIWYYCKYYNNQSYVYGYLYSVYCYPLSTIEPNTEQLDVVDKPFFADQTVQTQTTNDKLSVLPKQAQIVIIVIVCLPCLLIVYLLFKPTKLAVDTGKNKKKKIKRLRKSDYYELDE